MALERPSILLVSRSFVIREEDGRILLLKRSATDRHRPGEWECPGGKLDAGEDFSDSRLREVQEETGLVVETVRLAFYTDTRVIKDGSEYDGASYVAIFSIARVVEGVLTLSAEHDEALWVTCKEMLARPDLTPEVRRAAFEFSFLMPYA